MTLALIAALPFLGALLPGLMIRAGRDTCALVTGSFTALALLLLGLNAPAVLRGEVVTDPHRLAAAARACNANFCLDGLGLLFAGLILGIGLLIILYARFYLAKSRPDGAVLHLPHAVPGRDDRASCCPTTSCCCWCSGS